MSLVGSTPYITPTILKAEPTGISWGSIPSKNSTPQQQAAAQMNICQVATTEVDAICQVPLRATIDTEVIYAPYDTFRSTVLANGVTRLMMSRPPITKVISATWSPSAAFPSNPTTIAVDQFKIEYPLIGIYGTTAPAPGGDSGGQTLLLAPGFVSRATPRLGVELSVTYSNGWPHTSLTVAAAVGDSTIQVDDICSWTGARGVMRDVYVQEAATVTAVTPNIAGALSGPGTLTLSSALANAYAVGTMFSSMPYPVIEAAILLSVAKALTRGTTAIVAQTMGGHEVHTGGKVDELISEAEVKLIPYRRIL